MNKLRFEVLSFDRGQQSSPGSENKFVHSHLSEKVSFKIHKQVSCISYLSYVVLPLFFSPVGEKKRR